MPNEVQQDIPNMLSETQEVKPLDKTTETFMEETEGFSLKLSELSDSQYETLLQNIQKEIQSYLDYSRAEESISSPETLDSEERVEANKVHMDIVRRNVVEIATSERGLLYIIDNETGEVHGGNEYERYPNSRPLLPVDTKVRRQAEIAAMLHDIDKHKAGKKDQARLLFHHLWSAETAKVILTNLEVDDSDIEVIAKAIEEHQAMPFVVDALNLAKAGDRHWSQAESAVKTEYVSREDLEKYWETTIREYNRDYEKFENRVDAIPDNASEEEWEQAAQDLEELRIRGAVVQRLINHHPDDIFIPGEQIGWENMSKIYKTWSEGAYGLPTNDVSALLFAADLMSPKYIVHPDVIAAGVSNRQYELDPSNLEGVGAAALDRYVEIQINQLGSTFMEGFDKSVNSLKRNTDRIQTLSEELFHTTEADPKTRQDLMRAGAILNVVSAGEASSAVLRMKLYIRPEVEKNYLEAKNLGAKGDIPNILTAYEDMHRRLKQNDELLATFEGMGVMNNPAYREVFGVGVELKKQLAEMRPAYLTKCKEILYTSAYRVQVEDALDAIDPKLGRNRDKPGMSDGF